MRFLEFLFTFEPEAVLSGFYWNQEKQFKVLVEIASDEFSAVLDFFITHAIPGTFFLMTLRAMFSDGFLLPSIVHFLF